MPSKLVIRDTSIYVELDAIDQALRRWMLTVSTE